MKNLKRQTSGPAAVQKAGVQNKVVEPIVVVESFSDREAAPVSDPSAMLSAIDAVRREVRTATDFDAVLHLITERALSLTGASGAALAFVTDDKMVCRASAGEPPSKRAHGASRLASLKSKEVSLREPGAEAIISQFTAPT
jgi:hypothetical protein